MSSISKDPDAKLDYGLTWDRWLRKTGDTIAESTWDVPSGITHVADGSQDTFTDTVTTVWLEGGTVGQRYVLTNTITTVAGRIAEGSLTIAVRES